MEFRDALEPFLQRHLDLHAREVRADAAVDAQPEGGVAVLLAVDHHALGWPSILAAASWVIRSSRGAALRFSISARKYFVVSPIAFISTSGRVMPTSRISWIQVRKRSPSSSGRPSITAITRTGISCA